MKGSEIVKTALINAGKTQNELAEFLGMSKQNLSYRMVSDAFSLEEIEKAIGFCGFQLKVVDKNGSDMTNAGNSSSPRVVQSIGGRTFDTSKAESICTAMIGTTDSFYIELFRDTQGQHFLAYYQEWDGGKNWITPIPLKEALGFISKYGVREAE